MRQIGTIAPAMLTRKAMTAKLCETEKMRSKGGGGGRGAKVEEEEEEEEQRS